MYSWKYFDFLVTRDQNECFAQEEFRKINEKAGWLWWRKLSKIGQIFKNFDGAPGWSQEHPGWSQGTSRVTFLWKLKLKCNFVLLYEFPGQKLGWQFTARCSYWNSTVGPEGLGGPTPIYSPDPRKQRFEGKSHSTLLSLSVKSFSISMRLLLSWISWRIHSETQGNSSTKPWSLKVKKM